MRHSYFTGNTLLSDVAGIVRLKCCTRVAMGRFSNKIAGTFCRIFIELNFLQHAADVGDTWLQVQPPLTSVAEQL